MADSSIFGIVSIGLGASIVGVMEWLRLKVNRASLAQSEKKIEKAQDEAKEQPGKAKPAWDLARANLDLYFERNRAQVGQVFFIAIIAMVAGFAFVLFGVYLALQNKGITATLVSGIAGIISQFIGATFMVIYRSTMNQANQFMSILERINIVGMAVQVLDSIPDTATELKNKTRAEIVELLLKSKTFWPVQGNTKTDNPPSRS